MPQRLRLDHSTTSDKNSLLTVNDETGKSRFCARGDLKILSGETFPAMRKSQHNHTHSTHSGNILLTSIVFLMQI